MLKVGSAFKDLENIVECFSKEKTTLKHNDGEVWLIDFWATWCPPCQGPMAHNQEMLEKNSEKWGDKVKIIGVSIDEDAETVEKHVTEKKWQKVKHYWKAESKCDDDYGVQGVPHVILVDTKGSITFIGHPSDMDLE